MQTPYMEVYNDAQLWWKDESSYSFVWADKNNLSHENETSAHAAF